MLQELEQSNKKYKFSIDINCMRYCRNVEVFFFLLQRKLLLKTHDTVSGKAFTDHEDVIHVPVVVQE
jgi:hypothetical protein